jgi:hypothetical protein
MPSPETVAAYAVSIGAVVAIIVQLVKQGLIDPRVADSPARDALLRAISYALNLGILLAVLGFNHQLDGSQILVYISLALGQSVISHVAYSTLSSGSAPVASAAPFSLVSPPANDVKVEAEPATDGAAAAIGGEQAIPHG